MFPLCPFVLQYQEVGELLQARRHTDFVVDFGCRAIDEYREEYGSDDPAAKDVELAAKLSENAKVQGVMRPSTGDIWTLFWHSNHPVSCVWTSKSQIAKKKTDEVFQQFVRRQEEDLAGTSKNTEQAQPSSSAAVSGSARDRGGTQDKIDADQEVEEDDDEDEDENGEDEDYEKAEEERFSKILDNCDDEDENSNEALICWKKWYLMLTQFCNFVSTQISLFKLLFY